MQIIPYKAKNQDFDISEERFAIADDDGKIVDDAQGWGYKTKQKAHKAIWYKFQGGQQKIKRREINKKKFLKKHIGLENFLNDIMENNFKEIARGEVTNKDILDCIKEEFNVDMPEEYIDQ